MPIAKTMAAWFFFLMVLSSAVQAQQQGPAVFEISVPAAYGLASYPTDTARLQALLSANPTARAALASVDVFSFYQEFPASHYRYLRSIYLLSCAGTAAESGAILSLHTGDPAHFPYVRQRPVIALLGAYTPDDYHGVPGADCSAQLDYIRATTAWGVTRGDPRVILGINDPSGFDLHNPDLEGQIVAVNSGNSPDFHGTVVAGCAAAHTDNGIGIAGIGFDCKLNVDNSGGDYINLNMSAAGIRVINNSWFYGFACTADYQPWIFSEEELVYDEVYENGATTCFASGNGLSGFGACPSLYNYEYPSSLDHIINVGGVGHVNALGDSAVVNSSCPPSGIPWLWRDCHEQSPGNALGQYGTLNYQATDRVDICAPAYNVVSTDYAANDTSVHYISGACGTSFACPMVTGTLGLMLSANACLSPYQLEYLLKSNARNIDYVEYPPGSGINLNQNYVGMMGAGALDAGAAVTAASTFDCNDTNTQTMYIEGIGINTICAPGYSSNGAKPVLTTVVDHGVPPYTYRWDPLPGNNCTLDNLAAASPTVTGGSLLAYRLGVYDASPVPKEASRLIVIQLTTEQTPKLVLRDSYMDMLDEPNAQADQDGYDWQLWLSPDIVNRQANDHILVNQNPVYTPGTPSYATTRITNAGCTASSGTELLDLYWALAGTGQTWPGDWTTATFTNAATHISSQAGAQITVSPLTIPALQPGAQDTLSAAWYPPDPQDFNSADQSVDISLLGRIETSTTAPYGMSTPEGPNTAINAIGNNKIATRSLVVNSAAGPAMQWHEMIIGNAEDTAQQFALEFATERQLHPSFSGDFNAYARVEIALGALYDRWVAGGSQGTNFIVDGKAKSIAFTGTDKIILNGIRLQAGEKVAVRVGILLAQQPLTNQYFHIRQWLDTAYASAIPYGNVSFMIPACVGCAQPSGAVLNSVSLSTGINVFPNPASGLVTVLYTGYEENMLSFAVSDISGQKLYEQSGMSVSYGSENTLDLSAYSPGLYFIKVTDQNNNSSVVKIVKE